MKPIGITLLVLVLIVGGIFVFMLWGAGGESGQQPDGQIGNGTEDPDANQTTWERYGNAQFNFTFEYPAEAETRVEAGRAKVTYLGPDAMSNTEITDGFTFYVDTAEVPTGASLAAAADAVFEKETVNRNAISEPSSITIGGREMYVFDIESELGPTVTHVVLPGDADTAVVASYMIADPGSRGYEVLVRRMLSSIRFVGDDQAADPPLFSHVSIALLDTEFEGDPERGCDRVVLVERDVTDTTAPLSAALTELFSIDATDVGGHYNFMAKTNDTLSFDRATVEGGTARVYLEGSLSGLAGVCDNPRAQIQIEETALQFSTVDRVEIYLNGTRTDLTPSEQ